MKAEKDERIGRKKERKMGWVGGEMKKIGIVRKSNRKQENISGRNRGEKTKVRRRRCNKGVPEC